MVVLIAYAAGADLAELANISTTEAFTRGWLKDLNDAVEGFRKPIIAAVRGFAVCSDSDDDHNKTNSLQFGGGFELALLVRTD